MTAIGSSFDNDIVDVGQKSSTRRADDDGDEAEMPPLGLFDRAKTMLGGRSSTPQAPQYYQVACVEGHVLHGRRTEGYQALRCPTCGEGIFVLPRSPLPDPAPPSSVLTRRRPSNRSLGDDDPLVLTDPPSPSEIAQARSGFADGTSPKPVAEAEAEIEWVDEVDEAPAPNEPKPRSTFPAQRNEPKPKPRPNIAPDETNPSPKPTRKPKARPTPVAAPNEPKVRAGLIAVEDRPTLGEWVAKRRNPLIFLAVTIVVIGTLAIRFRAKTLDELPRVAEIGRIQGLAKLDAGEFQVAKKLLDDAASAVDALGGRYEAADAIRQGAREAAIFADLASDTLEQLIEKAARYQPADAWPAHFDAIYKGQSVVFEDDVSAVPNLTEPGTSYKISYQILYGGETKAAGRGRVDLRGFKLFEQTSPKVGDHKVFGARLAAISFDADSGDWLVSFQPDSGVFITHYKALNFVWPVVEPIEEAR